MKSLEELYKEVQENEELKKEFITSFKEGSLESFLSSHNCDATASDVMEFLRGTEKILESEDDLSKVAGGGCSSGNTCGPDCATSVGARQNELGYC